MVMKMNNNRDGARRAEAPIGSFDPIDSALRQLFDDVSEEEIPDDFTALVAQFAEQQSKRGEK